MKRVHNKKLLEKYMNKYNINEIFTEDMSSHMELILYKKNEYICKVGEEMNYLIFFVDGKVKVYSSLSNGKSLLLCFYEGFRILGDVELINNEPASTNVKAIQDTYCVALKIKDIKDILMRDNKFLKVVCESLGSKLTRCSKNSSINLLYPLENKLASYIIATQEKTSEGKKVFKGNLKETSELLGASYRHLLRTLNVLSSKNIINKIERGYEIIDEESLKILATEIYS